MAHKPDIESLADLGLTPGASFEEAKKRYRKLAQSLHPDRNKEPSAAEKFKVISVAYAQLERRSAAGLWDEPWAAAWASEPPPAHQASPRGSSRRPAPPAPLYEPHSSWRTYSFQRASMSFLESGYSHEISKAFFKSYATAAASGVGADPSALGAITMDLARGYLMLLSIYKKAWTEEELAGFRIDFLEQAWALEKAGLLKVLDGAKQQASQWMRLLHPSLISAIAPETVYISINGGRSFSLLHAISEPREGIFGMSQLRWHKEVSERFKKVVGGAENFEQQRDVIHKAKDFRGRPFAVRLMEERPELFGIYMEAEWINPRHGLYAARGFDFASSLWRSEVPWRDKAEVLWSLLGPEGCGRKMAAMPIIAQEAADALASKFIEAGRVDDVAAEFQTPAMRRASVERRRFEKLCSASAPLLGFGVAARALAWASRGRPKSISVGKAFRAVAKEDLDALRQSLSDAKFEGVEVAQASLDGVPLAVFIAWKNFFKPGCEEFCEAALGLVHSSFGASALRVADSQGSSAEWWTRRKAEVSPKRAPKPTAG